MVKRYGLLSVLLLLCILLCASPAWAQWVKNGTVVCNVDFPQNNSRAVSDGSNGMVVIWMDLRNGSDYDIYGNRIDADGNVLGGLGGVPICIAAGNQTQYQLIPDGTGGAIVAWDDARDGENNIFAQRVDGIGVARWAENGIPVCAAIGSQDGARIVPDGAGGAIIVWGDNRGGQYDIYAQRVSADGDTLWAADGIPVDASANDQYMPEAVSDGSGGAIIIWVDIRSGDFDIYAQRIDGDGDLLWGAGAVPICEAPGYPYTMRLAAASGGGACVTWADYRDGYGDIYAQKIDQDGNALWQDDGVAVCPASWNKGSSQIADDGSGGAIVAWYDERNYYEVYAQRIDQDGNLSWPQYGTLVFPSYGDGDISLMADGAGGAIVALDIYWDEESSNDIYAQRLDHGGNLLWGPKGAAVCAAPQNQFYPAQAPDGRGGVIVAWEDDRFNVGNGGDIYCQRIGPSGLWGNAEPEIVSCLDVPADQGGWVRIKMRASSHDVAGEYDSPIAGYNVWRLIGGAGPFAASPSAANGAGIDRSKLIALCSDPATAKDVRVGGADAIALGLPPGDWESVGFWFATRDTMYNIAVPTKDDSTGAGTPWEDFIVTAHAAAAGVFAASEPIGGYSVDNLAPGLTSGFAGNESAAPPGLALSWASNAASDLWKYDVHRGDDALFVPDESNVIGSTAELALLDPTWHHAFFYFYKLIAVDRHGNKSVPALLSPEDIKVGTLLTSFAASLKQSAIEVSWTLSEAGADVRFSVFRSSAGAGAFEELDSPAIARSGLSFSMSDKSCEPGTTYRYRVAVVEKSGSRTLFETDAISTPAMPLTLHQNHPNPFNPSTTVSYYLPEVSVVTLEVYDSSGRLVTRLADHEKQEKGTHSVGWRGLDAQGRTVSSGVYFYRLTSGKETISKKMVLLR